MEEKPKCGTCDYWAPGGAVDQTAGECRHDPPGFNGFWPPAFRDSGWCGQHSAIERRRSVYIDGDNNEVNIPEEHHHCPTCGRVISYFGFCPSCPPPAGVAQVKRTS
jgi:hypothetical protein